MVNIEEIKKELLTQDNIATNNPMFVVFQKKEYPTTSEYSYDRSYWRDDEGEIGDWDDVKNDLIEHHLNKKELNKMKDYEIENYLEVNGYEEVFVFEVNVFVQAFFTSKYAKRYIETNKHRLNKPFFYVSDTYRNYEIQAVRNHLMQTIENEPISKCEYCGSSNCSDIGDGIQVCPRCEEILDKHIKISKGEILE